MRYLKHRIIMKLLSLLVIIIFMLTDFFIIHQKIEDFKKILPPPIVRFIDLRVPYAVADVFMQAVEQGKQLGGGNIESYKPQNLPSTIQEKGLGDINKITPRVEEAQQIQSDYTQYYTNPGGMANAPIDEDTKEFLRKSYNQADTIVQSYTRDQTFGNKCIEKNEEGQCTKWSISDKILYENFPDCEMIKEPVYDSPPNLQTCTVNVTPFVTDLCNVTSHITIVNEWREQPCNMINSDHINGQFYMVCRDYYDWYRVPSATMTPSNTPYIFTALNSTSQLPQGASFVFTGTNHQDYKWDWYAKFKGSYTERLILSSDNSCGLNFNEMVNQCTAEYVEVCESGWNNCLKIVENGEPTGLLPEEEYIIKYNAGYYNFLCEEICTSGWFMGVRCDCSPRCYQGVCYPNAPLRSSLPPGLTLVGKEKADVNDNCYLDPDFGMEGECSWTEYEYYTDRRVCRNVAGGIENYVICLGGDNIKIDNGTGFRQITKNLERVDGSCLDVGRLTVTYFYLYGDLNLRDTGYIWNGKIRFLCGSGSEEGCQHLVNQGCSYHSHICLDSDCNTIEYTYNCGGTGEVIGYNVQYVCPDGIRCMGSECHDPSYEANDDFQKAVIAFEILNMYRADSDGIYIFPGDDSRCQSKPNNCCKNPGVGISIGDYINAARAAITAYKLITGGIAATWSSFAAAFSHILAGGNVFRGLAGLAGLSYGSQKVVTTVTMTFDLSATTAIGATVVPEAGGYAITVQQGLVSNLATVMTVVTIALTVYTIVKFIYDFIFRCTREDIVTSYKVGLRLCHYVGEYCAAKVFGTCIKRKKTYCCFNSILARLVHECVRPQVGRAWGGAKDPDCGGLLPGELASADLGICDFTEYMQHVQYKTSLTEEDIQNATDRLKATMEQLQ